MDTSVTSTMILEAFRRLCIWEDVISDDEMRRIGQRLSDEEGLGLDNSDYTLSVTKICFLKALVLYDSYSILYVSVSKMSICS
jgi:alanine-alpha-ketoisovalerate/valine-pyruvate aminotransferase